MGREKVGAVAKHVEFYDPLPTLPALERQLVKLRSFEITLSLYYAEEIARLVFDMIDGHDNWRASSDPLFEPRAPHGSKKRFDKALRAMVVDGAISSTEKKFILEVRNFRNTVAHETDLLFFDLEKTNFSGWKPCREDRLELGFKEYDHSAFSKFEEVFSILNRAALERYRVGTFSLRGHLMFSTAETYLKSEIQSTRMRLGRLFVQRKRDISKLKQELKLGFGHLSRIRRSRFFDIRFNRGPMTKRGSEVCYQLFDLGLTDFAVAHIFEMSISSISKRKRQWNKAGGSLRQKLEIEDIPIQFVRSPYDD